MHVRAPVCRHRHRHHDPHVEISLQHSGVDSFLLLCGQGHWTPLIKLGGECLYLLSLLPALKLTFDQESSVSRQQLLAMVVDWWMHRPHKGDLSAGQLRLTSRSLSWEPRSCCSFDLMPLLKGRNVDRKRLSSINLTLHITHFLEPLSWPVYLTCAHLLTHKFLFFLKNVLYIFCAHMSVYKCMWDPTHDGTCVEVKGQLAKVGLLLPLHGPCG